MNSPVVLGAVAIAAATVLGVGVPAAIMRMLAPSLAQAPKRVNFRGSEVHVGLGIAWLVWAGTAIIAGLVASAPELAPSVILVLAGPLALVAFAMGVVDDAFGTGADRGFKGHIKAGFQGRLTTGGLKLLGIGAASLVVALIVGEVAPWGGWSLDEAFSSPETLGLTAAYLIGVLIAGASIALTSNFINLTDLRPGRALKVYVVLALAGAASTAFGLARVLADPDTPYRMPWLSFLVLAIFVLGPVIAVWRYDLGEVGMLGDAGANPMGAVAGLLIVAGLPFWALLVYFVAVLALNLASERFSFTRVIESNAVLRRIDEWGRSATTRETR